MKYRFSMLIFSLLILSGYVFAETALVAGGAGFIGSHMCEALLEEGYNVICIDDLSTGNTANINHLTEKENFRFIKHDVTESLTIEEEIDEIYNFACPASPEHYQRDPIKTFKTNILGSLNLLELAHKNNAKIFQASTSEVYGDPITHPQKESYWGNVNPIGIRACYDEGKRGAETLFFDYHRTHKTRIKVGRIFNTYGPRMCVNDGRVVSNFVIQSLSGEPITVFGKGEQTRSFCYVDDLVRGIRSFMNTGDACTGPINLGNTEEFTILELAQRIIKYTNSDSKIVFESLPQDDPKRRRPELTLAEKHLNYKPIVSAEEGLRNTIDYFSNVLLSRS